MSQLYKDPEKSRTWEFASDSRLPGWISSWNVWQLSRYVVKLPLSTNNMNYIARHITDLIQAVDFTGYIVTRCNLILADLPQVVETTCCKLVDEKY